MDVQVQNILIHFATGVYSLPPTTTCGPPGRSTAGPCRRSSFLVGGLNRKPPLQVDLFRDRRIPCHGPQSPGSDRPKTKARRDGRPLDIVRCYPDVEPSPLSIAWFVRPNGPKPLRASCHLGARSLHDSIPSSPCWRRASCLAIVELCCWSRLERGEYSVLSPLPVFLCSFP